MKSYSETIADMIRDGQLTYSEWVAVEQRRALAASDDAELMAEDNS
jgi:hypothetical protein